MTTNIKKDFKKINGVINKDVIILTPGRFVNK